MNYEDFFLPAPHALDRSRWPGQRPLAVFFEQGDCHACDVLHTGPLHQDDISQRFQKWRSCQLDMWSDTPVLTPAGERTTARQWADRLGLFYTPTLIFFDERGKEILRVDSVVQFYRLRNVVDYVIQRRLPQLRDLPAVAQRTKTLKLFEPVCGMTGHAVL